ncbi:MAG: DUF84 family protein [Acidobacteria bacterium]|nr:DUF84 family protein [Acidobacteriota bacterium]
MIVALASTRAPKVAALEAALRTLAGADLIACLNGSREVEIITRQVEGQGPAMPLNDEEMMIGAQSRAQLLAEQLASDAVRADFYVGLEGGFHIEEVGEEDLVFLRGWAYVTDGVHGHFGASPSICVPAIIANPVVDNGRELGEVIDQVAGEFDVRSRQGTWGILSCDLINRCETFRLALLAAFAPFYNRPLYRSPGRHTGEQTEPELRQEA